MPTSSKRFAQVVFVSIGFAAASFAWSCPNNEGTEGPTDGDVSNAEVDRAQSLSASDFYRLFHDPRLNKPDGLGDYTYDFQAK